MKVEISNITECNIDIVVSEAGELDGNYGVEYQPQQLDAHGIHGGKGYCFTHLPTLMLGDVIAHFLVKKWEDGAITVFCHVTKDGDKVAEATGRA